MVSNSRIVAFHSTSFHCMQSADMPGAALGAQAPSAPAQAPASGPQPSSPLNPGDNPFAIPAPGNTPFNPTPMFNTILITGDRLNPSPGQGLLCCMSHTILCNSMNSSLSQSVLVLSNAGMLLGVLPLVSFRVAESPSTGIQLHFVNTAGSHDNGMERSL